MEITNTKLEGLGQQMKKRTISHLEIQTRHGPNLGTIRSGWTVVSICDLKGGIHWIASTGGKTSTNNESLRSVRSKDHSNDSGVCGKEEKRHVGF